MAFDKAKDLNKKEIEIFSVSFYLLAVGGGGIPSVRALAISWLNGKGAGGGGKLKFIERFGKRLAMEFVGCEPKMIEN